MRSNWTWKSRATVTYLAVLPRPIILKSEKNLLNLVQRVYLQSQIFYLAPLLVYMLYIFLNYLLQLKNLKIVHRKIFCLSGKTKIWPDYVLRTIINWGWAVAIPLRTQPNKYTNPTNSHPRWRKWSGEKLFDLSTFNGTFKVRSLVLWIPVQGSSVSRVLLIVL
jgi:hypothetical protein